MFEQEGKFYARWMHAGHRLRAEMDRANFCRSHRCTSTVRLGQGCVRCLLHRRPPFHHLLLDLVRFLRLGVLR
jgi:hypothetical protein